MRKRLIPQKYEKGFLARVPGSTALGRRLNAAFGQVVRDCGGADSMTVGKLMLAERLCFLDEVLRQLERAIAPDPTAKPELVGRWTQGLNAMSGIIKTLGLDRERQASYIDALYSDPDETIPAKAPGGPADAAEGQGGDETPSNGETEP